MRSRFWMIAVALTAAAPMFPMQESVSAQSGTGIVISEFRFRGPNGINDEFIELFNAGTEPVNIGGWLVRVSNNNTTPSIATRATIPAGTTIGPGCYYLVANTNLTGGYSGSVAPNLTYATGYADDGGVALMANLATMIDQAGLGTNGAYGEGERLLALTTDEDRGYERRPGGAAGHADTDDNATDFQVLSPGTPQNASSACITAAVLLPHEVQGAGAASPMEGTTVTVRGVVTGRTSDGFFLQTEPGHEDADANTSEGLFVFTGAAPTTAPVGHLVQVAGLVAEFVPPADPASPSRTQLTTVTSVTDLGASVLPDPYLLTSPDLSDTGALDQLERLEGMRVTAASLTAVSGSTVDGVFYAVLSGQPRPFREPGIEAGYPVPACALAPCNIPLFDGNPERLRVDAGALEGVARVDVSSGAVMAGVTGPLDFGSRTYTVLPETALVPSGGVLPLDVPAAPAGQYSIATLTMNRFYDADDDPGRDEEVPSAAAYDARLSKASLMVRASLNLPDLIGLLEVENVGVLQDLAARIDADEAAAGHPAPAYVPLLVEHDNQDGLDVAFLVKPGRVSPVAIEQVGADDTNEHPSLVLHAVVSGPPTLLPQALTVIVSQLPSPAEAAERHARAVELASYIQGRQINDPNEAIVAVGGYSAFAFNDGQVDVVGTVRGLPAPPDQVAVAAADMVSPDLVDVGESLPGSERYSFVGNGNAQEVDHVLMSANLAAQFVSLEHARVNAGFPEAFGADAATASRLSDRDPLVAYFAFPPDVSAPVFSFAPGNQDAEATAPKGAVVNYESPTATDNLDPVVTVSCVPSSGSVFPLGNSGVTCSAQDLAGNLATTAFTVRVSDTTAPEITGPGNLAGEAQSWSGRQIDFAVTAADAATPSPSVSCTPASGSVFAIGVTTVGCMAADDAGNVSTSSFAVTVTLPILGRMHGAGHVTEPEYEVSFAFDVRESPNFEERGSLRLSLRDGEGRPDRFVAAGVTEVRFADREGSSPGQVPGSGVDTVVVTGLGWWNGRPGYAFEVRASDLGEPGPGLDTLSLVVTAPDGTVVESVSGVLRDGNIQSLR